MEGHYYDMRTILALALALLPLAALGQGTKATRFTTNTDSAATAIIRSLVPLNVGAATNTSGVAVNDLAPKASPTFSGIVTAPILSNGGTFSATNQWDITNVKWWGAKGDGVTDDYLAITNAIHYARMFGSNSVTFPPGRFSYSTNLYVTDVSLIGIPGKTFLKPMVNVHTALTLNSTPDINASTSAHMIVSGINLDGLATTSAVGIHIGSTLGVTIFVNDCEVKGFSGGLGIGVYVNNAIISGLNNCVIARNDINVHIEGSDVSLPTTFTFQDCDIRLSQIGPGARLVNGWQVNFINTVFEANKQQGLQIIPGANQLVILSQIESCWFESSWYNDPGAGTNYSLIADGTSSLSEITGLSVRDTFFNNGPTDAKATYFNLVTSTLDNVRANTSTTQFIIRSSNSIVNIQNMVDGIVDTQLSNPDGAIIQGSYHGVRSDANYNVGIGTTSPKSKTHIVGTKGSLTSINDFNMGLIVDDNTAIGVGNGGGISFRAIELASPLTYSTFAAIDAYKEDAGESYKGSLRFLTANNSVGYPVEHMRIMSTGNVGIGTTTPMAKLHVNGNIKTILTNVSLATDGNGIIVAGGGSATNVFPITVTTLIGTNGSNAGGLTRGLVYNTNGAGAGYTALEWHTANGTTIDYFYQDANGLRFKASGTDLVIEDGLKIVDLSGTGTRLVTADPDGVLGTSSEAAYLPTNTANYSTAGVAYALDTLYTNLSNARGLLVGTFSLTAATTGTAQIRLNYTNDGVGYFVQGQNGVLLEAMNTSAFSVPINPGGTFIFVSTFGTSASGDIIGTTLWKQ